MQFRALILSLLLAIGAAFLSANKMPAPKVVAPAPRASPLPANLMFDMELDNSDIPTDSEIAPARKCKMCFG